MEKSHPHSHGCTHCACNNPVLKILKEELFSPENLAKMKPFSGAKIKAKPQPIMISGGTIRPMIGGSTDVAEAIGIADGHVVATGDKKTVKKIMDQKFPGYQKKELSGTQTLLPGLIEPHVHMVPTAMMADWLDVSPFNGQDLKPIYDLTSVGAIVNNNIPKIPGYVILGRGLDPSLMPFVVKADGTKELQTIDNTVLDSINDEEPIMLLSASMHTLYLNTKALQHVYQHSDTVKNQYKSADEYILATRGQLQESPEMTPALKVVMVQIIAMSIHINKYLTELFQLANSRGVTFMYDAGLNKGFEKLLSLYFETHHESVRTGGAYICSS